MISGTAVYVYFILANFVAPGVTTDTWANFTLDDQFSGTFHHAPSNSTDFQFNSLVFSKEGLPNANHILIISTSGPNNSFTSFDYANYTFDDIAPPIPVTSESVPLATIAGGIIGGIVVILVPIMIYLRRRRSVDTVSESEVTPFIDRPSSEASRQDRISLPLDFTVLSFRKSRPTPFSHSDNGMSGESSSSESAEQTGQAGINQQIERLTREIQVLADQQSTGNASIAGIPSFQRPRSEGVMLALEEQLERTRSEIGNLQARLQSEYAQGLSNDPPPDYLVSIQSNENRC
ncbi:hypothetical protein H0H92_013858 [Tricholoma furcatifolium]|nr:hypothetical protein H0H92_013858 [Tricholoma furcatifolium]